MKGKIHWFSSESPRPTLKISFKPGSEPERRKKVKWIKYKIK